MVYNNLRRPGSVLCVDGSRITVDPEYTACFTGHRPEKIPFDVSDGRNLEALKSELYKHISLAARRGYNTFLCGLQRGVDIWAGEQVMILKQQMPKIRLICVSPFRAEINTRRGGDLYDYNMLIKGCDGFTVLREDYANFCFYERNRFMVDRSSLIIAAVADMKSGTGQTINYAKRRGLIVDKIDLLRLQSLSVG